MSRRFYPAVLERGEHGAVGLWFPDFPGCVVGARTQEEAMDKASQALELAMEAVVERNEPLPTPSLLEDIRPPPESDVIGYVAIGATPPQLTERVNVYLPKALIDRVDRRADELGMSRSSLFGMAVSALLGGDVPRAYYQFTRGRR